MVGASGGNTAEKVQAERIRPSGLAVNAVRNRSCNADGRPSISHRLRVMSVNAVGPIATTTIPSVATSGAKHAVNWLRPAFAAP